MKYSNINWNYTILRQAYQKGTCIYDDQKEDDWVDGFFFKSFV